MKAYLINMHLLAPRSRSSAKVKVRYKGYISQKMVVSGGIRVSQTHLVQKGFLSFLETTKTESEPSSSYCSQPL